MINNPLDLVEHDSLDLSGPKTNVDICVPKTNRTKSSEDVKESSDRGTDTYPTDLHSLCDDYCSVTNLYVQNTNV